MLRRTLFSFISGHFQRFPNADGNSVQHGAAARNLSGETWLLGGTHIDGFKSSAATMIGNCQTLKITPVTGVSDKAADGATASRRPEAI